MSMTATGATVHPVGGADDAVRARELGPTTVLLTVAGEVDAACDAALLDRIERSLRGYHQLVLDLSGVNFFGAAGYAFLNRLDAFCARTATDWVLIAGSEVRRLLRVCDPGGVLPSAPNVVSAVAALARGPHRTPLLGAARRG